MRYNTLGKTGLRVSEIGMGCEGFVDRPYEHVKELIDIMEESGANCIDLYSPDPEFRSNLGRALRGRRDKFILQAQLCTVWKNGQYECTRDLNEVRESFEDQLRRLETDHAEICLFHYVDSLATWEEIKNGPLMDYAQGLKAAGTIKALGISCHNPIVALSAVNSGLMDAIMFSVNPCYDLLPGTEDCEDLWDDKNYEKPLTNMDPERQELYETCQRLGVGITVMKAFGGGDLMDAGLSPAGKALTAYQCLHYALSRPAVATVMSGAKTAEELRESLGYEDAPESERDYAAALAALPRISWRGHCMYCGHCAPCPVGISVADVTKFLNLTLAQGMVPETVRQHYEVLPHHAGECIGCGACEGRCPFGVPSVENMQKAAGVFGK